MWDIPYFEPRPCAGVRKSQSTKTNIEKKILKKYCQKMKHKGNGKHKGTPHPGLRSGGRATARTPRRPDRPLRAPEAPPGSGPFSSFLWGRPLAAGWRLVVKRGALNCLLGGGALHPRHPRKKIWKIKEKWTHKSQSKQWPGIWEKWTASVTQAQSVSLQMSGVKLWWVLGTRKPALNQANVNLWGS